MATPTKAKFNTFEGQARLLRALVAAHPEVKWNYKDIAKYLGQFTPGGVRTYFRTTVKKDADILREVADADGDVAKCLPNFGSATTVATNTTPRKTPSKATAPRSGSTTGGRKVKHPSSIKRCAPDVDDLNNDADDDDDCDENPSPDWSEQDVADTPSKNKRIKTGETQRNTPTRQAATKVVAAIADTVKQLESASEAEMATAGEANAEPVEPEVIIKQEEPEHKPNVSFFTDKGNKFPGVRFYEDDDRSTDMSLSMGEEI